MSSSAKKKEEEDYKVQVQHTKLGGTRRPPQHSIQFTSQHVDCRSCHVLLDGRMGMEECLSHPWICSGGGKQTKVVSTSGIKYSSSNDTKMPSILSLTAMSSTISTIMTSHLHISNSNHHKFDHCHLTKTQMSNCVRNARKKLSKFFSFMKNSASSGNDKGGAAVMSSLL
eukprot:11212548-Ditylum_brightwellii.AAC.1